MAGIWNETAPIRPGMGLKFETYGTKATPAGDTGVVGLPITSDWGPIGEHVLLASDAQYREVFGPNAGPDTAYTGYLVQDAFRGGANKVLAYRMAGTGAAAATKTLKDGSSANAGAGTDSFVLTAKYSGTRGNGLKFAVSANPIYTTTKKDLKIYEGSTLIEVYTFDVAATLASLAAKINTRSRLVTATVFGGYSDTGANTLKTITATSLTGGNNGAALVLADYVAAMDAYAAQDTYDVFTLPDISEADASGLNTAVTNWTQQLNDEGKYVMTVVGGDAAEDVDDVAIVRAKAINNENVVVLGATDLKVWYPGITDPIVRSTAAMTARAAGLIAAAGVGRSITNMELGTDDSPVELVAGLRKAEYEAADLNGLVTFSKRAGRVVIEEGVTSFTAYTNAKDETFGQIKAVRTMHQIGRDFTRIIETSYVGATNNTPATQSSILSIVSGYLKNLEDQGVVMPGHQVLLDDRFDNTGEDVYVLILVQFVKELKRVLMTLRAPLY